MSKIIVDQLSHAQKVRILYKTILRLHRGLPQELRDLGDKYARDEFRRHLACSPMEAQLFMTEWAKYAVTITSQLGLKGKPTGTLGGELDTRTVEMLKDDQVVQLYELMIAAKGLEDTNTVKTK
ncbi:succinate dehydrogenase assembly factor 3, mitochondrial-like [Rhagoletis pomonella]|uniref:succinate dehydrogenase assembly factor 3, mitochondrial-like n=1 Tax=Rhagoletis pomonella TaxID=28610 RepID=UPI00177DD925|nr:succinate dehydrogenase assembly factor 3, mitochondrial-like [Rhagoletis pomonella]XP_036343145.1 succinate dehydrogenase assembly factor 3, mitochondrial-like [Rhagoletis pomonella]